MILSQLCDLELWLHPWPWPWISQGQILKLLYIKNCWSGWCEINGKQSSWIILDWLCHLALCPHPWPWPWIFKVEIHITMSFKNGLVKCNGSLIRVIQWCLSYMVLPTMMTPSNGNIFRIIIPLHGEFTGHQWIPFTKASDAELWSFLWSTPELTVG